MIRHVELSNRVLKLESHYLNEEFNRILDQHVEGVAASSERSEEFKLLLKLYVNWALIREKTTVGMKIFGMKYHDSGGSILSEPHRLKLVLLSACTSAFPYLASKLSRRLEHFDTAVTTLKILNFFLFLRGGQLLITERLLGLARGIDEENYHRARSINKVQMELLSRELIWKTLAEFLTFVIPLINVEYIKSASLRWAGLMSLESSKPSLAEAVMNEKQLSKCAICDKQPFNPYTIGCRHLFCYYCLHSRHLLDPTLGYTCLICKYCTSDQFQVQRYRPRFAINND